MITGAHSVIYSKDPEADRIFIRDIFGFSDVDAGNGWLIFELPHTEFAVHPSNKNSIHKLYLMCDDIETFMVTMAERNVTCGPVQEQSWGLLTHITLPSGGQLGIYQPRHKQPGNP